MQNYFMALFMPLPIADAHPHDQLKHSAGIDTSYVPRLSCAQRLALNATKTENTSKTPLLPRPSVHTRLLGNTSYSLTMGISFLPPLPIPHFSVWSLAADSSVLFEPMKGIAIGVRGFLGVGYLRAEIATPFNQDDPIKDDWFSFGIFGADALSSFAIPITEKQKLYPFLSFGFVRGASLFAVADDGVLVPNDKYPLLSLTNFVGLSYHVFDQHLNISLSVGGALDAALTGHLRLAYLF